MSSNTIQTIYTFKKLSENTFLVNEQETSKEELINNYALYNGPVVNSEWFLETMKDLLQWGRVKYAQCRLEYIQRRADYVKWSRVFLDRSDITEEMIRANIEKIDLKHLSGSSKNVSTEFIREFADQFWWQSLLCYHQFTEYELREFMPYYKDSKNAWHSIGYHQKLTPGFIRDYFHKLSPLSLVERQTIPDDLIVEKLSELRGYQVERFQTISEETLVKHKNTLDIARWFYYNDYSDSLKEELGLTTHDIVESAYVDCEC